MKVKELIELLKPYEEYYVVQSDTDHEYDENIYIAPSLTYRYFTGCEIKEHSHDLIKPSNIKLFTENITSASHKFFESPSICKKDEKMTEEFSPQVEMQFDRFVKMVDILGDHKMGDNLDLIAMVWAATIVSICEKENDVERFEPLLSDQLHKKVLSTLPLHIRMKFKSGKD